MEERYTDFSTITDFESVVFVLHWENKEGEADTVGKELDKLFNFYKKDLEDSCWPVVWIKYGPTNKDLLPDFSEVPNFDQGKTVIFKLIKSKLEEFVVANDWKFEVKKLKSQGIEDRMSLIFIKDSFEEAVKTMGNLDLSKSLETPSTAIPPKNLKKSE